VYFLEKEKCFEQPMSQSGNFLPLRSSFINKEGLEHVKLEKVSGSP
jgi:hypothetical protein